MESAYRVHIIATDEWHDVLNLQFSKAWGSKAVPHLELTFPGGMMMTAGAVVELELWREDTYDTGVQRHLVLGREVWRVASVTWQETAGFPAGGAMGNTIVAFDQGSLQKLTAEEIEALWIEQIPDLPVPPKFSSPQEADDWMAKHEQSARKLLNQLREKED